MYFSFRSFSFHHYVHVQFWYFSNSSEIYRCTLRLTVTSTRFLLGCVAPGLISMAERLQLSFSTWDILSRVIWYESSVAHTVILSCMIPWPSSCSRPSLQNRNGAIELGFQLNVLSTLWHELHTAARGLCGQSWVRQIYSCCMLCHSLDIILQPATCHKARYSGSKLERVSGKHLDWLLPAYLPKWNLQDKKLNVSTCTALIQSKLGICLIYL